MKHVKRFAGILLALAMVLTMTTFAFAAQEGDLTGGSITIKDAVPKQTYKAYQILYLESYNKDAGTYAYKANSAWKTWLEGQTAYVSFNDQGYVTWVEDADVAAFAKLAQAEAATLAKEYYEEATAPAAAEGQSYSTVTFSNLKLGYYLVDTTVGTLCSLDTTNPAVEMEEKNDLPSIDKLVQEDSTNAWGASNTAQIGDTVNFKTTVSAKKGAQNYVVHDKMSAGLTFQGVTSVKAGETALVKDTDYSVVTTGLDADCDFHVVFTQAYLDKITADTDIVIEYTAILNDKAVISTDKNTNDTKLSYGESNAGETSWAHTDTYTFKFDIIKTDSSLKLLTGAMFELYDAEKDGNKIQLVKEENGDYRIATAAERSAEGFTSAVIEAGKVTVKGMDADTTYWLEEVAAPAGYNKLPARVEVKIEDSNLTTSMTGDTWVTGNGGVQITNQSGSLLPSTGGIGTTVFYIVGGVLVVVAVVLLVAKKRMNHKG
ncbi:MAG: SpaH/EbpB family LPXTG-anchored major pilin [Clostridiales bacterium]|nr:SpaH/EbpB family LPXTG-anchored major pilin [Clostridiales bacterium]